MLQTKEPHDEHIPMRLLHAVLIKLVIFSSIYSLYSFYSFQSILTSQTPLIFQICSNN